MQVLKAPADESSLQRTVTKENSETVISQERFPTIKQLLSHRLFKNTPPCDYTNYTIASRRANTYWLLLAEEEAAQLRIGSGVGEAEHGSRGLLLTLSHLIGWGYCDRRLLIGRRRRPHCQLKKLKARTVKDTSKQ